MNATAVEVEAADAAALEGLLREHRVVVIRNAGSDARALQELGPVTQPRDRGPT